MSIKKNKKQMHLILFFIVFLITALHVCCVNIFAYFIIDPVLETLF